LRGMSAEDGRIAPTKWVIENALQVLAIVIGTGVNLLAVYLLGLRAYGSIAVFLAVSMLIKCLVAIKTTPYISTHLARQHALSYDFHDLLTAALLVDFYIFFASLGLSGVFLILSAIDFLSWPIFGETKDDFVPFAVILFSSSGSIFAQTPRSILLALKKGNRIPLSAILEKVVLGTILLATHGALSAPVSYSLAYAASQLALVLYLWGAVLRQIGSRNLMRFDRPRVDAGIMRSTWILPAYLATLSAAAISNIPVVWLGTAFGTESAGRFRLASIVLNLAASASSAYARFAVPEVGRRGSRCVRLRGLQSLCIASYVAGAGTYASVLGLFLGEVHASTLALGLLFAGCLQLLLAQQELEAWAAGRSSSPALARVVQLFVLGGAAYATAEAVGGDWGVVIGHTLGAGGALWVLRTQSRAKPRDKVRPGESPLVDHGGHPG